MNVVILVFKEKTNTTVYRKSTNLLVFYLQSFDMFAHNFLIKNTETTYRIWNFDYDDDERKQKWTNN